MAGLSRVNFLSASTSPTAFLYQTRTLLSLCRSLPPCHEPRRNISMGRDETKQNNSDDISPANQNNNAENDPSRQAPVKSPAGRTSYLRQRGHSIPTPKLTNSKTSNPKRSPKKKFNTITRNEREAFGGLLARLKTGQSSLNSKQEPKQDSPLESRLPASSPKAENFADLMTVFESIMMNKQDALKESKSDKRMKENNQKQQFAHQTDQEYGQPDELEGISLSELGFQGSSSNTGVDPTVSVTEAINMIVERESKEIESQLFRAVEEGKGDSGLWEACRQRIFSMIDRIGGGASSPTSNLDSYSHAQVDKTQTSAPSSDSLNIPAAVPTGPVIAKLYPRLLLLAFRMLSTHFPESQLIGQFRAAVKEHSRTSAFLGTSQTLYEELMAFYWRSCNDLPAVVAFLRDMDNSGLYPSRRIRRLLQDIVRQRDEAMKAHQKAGDDFFWNAPPIHQAFEELAGPGGWIETINSQKEHRQNSTIPAFKM